MKVSFYIFFIGMFGCSICWGQSNHHLYLTLNQPALLTSNAGADVFSDGSLLFLGGTPAALGGTSPYVFTWTPSTGLNNPSIANPSLSPFQDIDYQLKVVDSNNCLSRDTITIKINGTNDLNTLPFTAIYSPADGTVAIHRSELFQATIQLSDINGRLIQTAYWPPQIQSLLISTGRLSHGIYLIHYVSNGQAFAQKICIGK